MAVRHIPHRNSRGLAMGVAFASGKYWWSVGAIFLLTPSGAVSARDGHMEPDAMALLLSDNHATMGTRAAPLLIPMRFTHSIEPHDGTEGRVAARGNGWRVETGDIVEQRMPFHAALPPFPDSPRGASMSRAVAVVETALPSARPRRRSPLGSLVELRVAGEGEPINVGGLVGTLWEAVPEVGE